MTTHTMVKFPALDEEAIIDVERGLPGGDLSAALRTFGDELEKRGAVIEELLISGELGELRSLAHGLKGSASTFCAPGLASAALSVEEKLAAKNADAIRVAIHELSAELKRVVKHVRDLLERRDRLPK